ncbi:MAG: hypothetical protein AAGB31_12330 [Bdellovibrio sp.]
MKWHTWGSWTCCLIFLPLQLSAFELAAGLTPPGQQKITLGYTGLFHQQADIAQDKASTSFQAFDFSIPVYKTEVESVAVSLNGSQLKVDPSQASPYSELYDLKVGLSYTRSVDEQRVWSISTRYGSASDKPFKDGSVNTIGATALYSFPRNETSRWLLLLDYSNNRPILNNIPLPGFAFFYYPSPQFRAVLGAPFASINWSFTDNMALDFFTLVPWIFKGSVSYKITEFARLYTGLDFSQITYYLHGRQNDQDRLFYDEKKIFVGIKSPLSQTVFAELELGHAFDRAFFIDENYTTNPDNPLELGNAYYAKLSLRARF